MKEKHVVIHTGDGDLYTSPIFDTLEEARAYAYDDEGAGNNKAIIVSASSMYAGHGLGGPESQVEMTTEDHT